MGDTTSRQLVLFAEGEQEQVLQESERARGVFSGKALQQYNELKYAEILRLLADDRLSVRSIALLTGSSRNLISAIKRECQDAIEPYRKELAKGFYHITQLCAERIEEILTDPESTPRLSELGILMGVAFDKGQLASGGATSISGEVGEGPTHGDLADELLRLKAEYDKRAAEDPGCTRSAGGKSEPAQIPAQDVHVGPAQSLEQSSKEDAV